METETSIGGFRSIGISNIVNLDIGRAGVPRLFRQLVLIEALEFRAWVEGRAKSTFTWVLVGDGGGDLCVSSEK